PVLAAVRRGGTRRADRHPLGVPRRAGRGDRHRPAYDDACGPRRRPQGPMSTNEWSGKGWTITVTDTEMALAQASGPVTISSTNAARLEVRRRWFRWSLHNDRQPLVHLRGITKTEASALRGALRRLALTLAIADAVAWYAAVTQLLAGARTEQRWISTETVDGLLATRPEPRLLDRVRAAGCEPSLTADQLEAVGFPDAHLESMVPDTNEQI